MTKQINWQAYEKWYKQTHNGFAWLMDVNKPVTIGEIVKFKEGECAIVNQDGISSYVPVRFIVEENK